MHVICVSVFNNMLYASSYPTAIKSGTFKEKHVVTRQEKELVRDVTFKRLNCQTKQ